MSGWGHSRRFRDVGRESAFSPLTDITSKTDHVGKVPIAVVFVRKLQF
jgi:hypothetical protein